MSCHIMNRIISYHIVSDKGILLYENIMHCVCNLAMSNYKNLGRILIKVPFYSPYQLTAIMSFKALLKKFWLTNMDVDYYSLFKSLDTVGLTLMRLVAPASSGVTWSITIFHKWWVYANIRCTDNRVTLSWYLNYIGHGFVDRKKLLTFLKYFLWSISLSL